MSPLLFSAHANFISTGCCTAPASRETTPPTVTAVNAAKIRIARPTRIPTPLSLHADGRKSGRLAAVMCRPPSDQYPVPRSVFQEVCQQSSAQTSLNGVIAQRPGEVRQRPLGRQAPRLQSPADEEQRDSRPVDERASRSIKGSGGEGGDDDRSPRPEDPFRSGRDELRLGGGPGEALKRERRAREHPARVAATRARLGAEQPERPPMCPPQPGAELQ